MRRNNKYIKILVTIVTVAVTAVIFASRPLPADKCQRNLTYFASLLSENFELEGKELKPFLPGKEFEKICEENQISPEFATKQCSYGLTFIAGKPKFYCKYHGDKDNMSSFSYLHFKRIKPDLEIPFGAIIISICIFFSSCMQSIKSFIKTITKN